MSISMECVELEALMHSLTSNNIIYAEFMDCKYDNEAEAIEAYLEAM